MPNFSTPLSGLDATQQALSVVANNLANMNTIGYKDEKVNFHDLFYQTLGTNGAGDSIQVGGGTAVGSIASNFSSGTNSSTGVPTDVAINGNGFFVTQLKGSTEYTRAGNLQVSTDGYLITQGGQYVMGYAASGGVITAGALSQLQVGTGQVIPAVTTTTMQMNTNLSSTAAVGSSFTSPPIQIYDSLGTAHNVSITYTKTASNNWTYTATIPDTDVLGGTVTGSPVTVGSGTLVFNTSGNLTTANATAVTLTTPSISGISLTNLADGSAPISLSWTAMDTNGNSLITQTASDSETSASSQNGRASGTLQSFAVQTDGTIQGAFSNGQTVAIGQLVLAQFGNQGGLALVGGNSYETTATSGQAVVGSPGTGGLGTMTGGSLEQSNVDMATEFSNMVVDQRAFEANAKVISAFDQVMQDTINLSR